MVNNYPDKDVVRLYACVCGETLVTEPGQVLNCCIDNGVEEELKDPE